MLKTSNDARKLLSNIELIAQTPQGIARLRELILTLAVQGKLINKKFEKTEKLKNIGNWAIGSGFPKELQGNSNAEIPFIKVSDMNLSGNEIYIKHANNYISLKTAQQNKIKIHPAGTVIFPKIGGAIATNKRRIIKSPTAIDNNCLGITPNENITTDYLFIFLQSIDMATYQVGTSVPALSQSILGEIEIPLPIVEEQSRIVARVEALMQLCDALEAQGRLELRQHQQLLATLLDSLTQAATAQELAQQWQRLSQHFDLLIDRPEAVDALEQTILQLAVRGLLVAQDPADEPASVLLQKIQEEKARLVATGKIKKEKPLAAITDEEKPFALPVGWEWVRVGDVVEMLNGYAFKSEWFKPKGIRLLRNLNISHGYIDWSQSVMLDSEDAKIHRAFSLNEGDLVLSLDRPIISTGLKYATIRKSDLPCLLLQRVARISPSSGAITSNYLTLWLQSDLFMGTIDPGRSNGIPHISTKQVANLTFGLPPLPEQSRIVARVTELRALCQQLRDTLTQARTTHTQLAQAWAKQAAA